MQWTEIAMRIDQPTARDIVEHALKARGFDVEWHSATYVEGVRGEVGRYAVLGPLAQYFKIGVNVYPAEEGVTVIRLQRLANGWYAGWLGALRVATQFRGLRDAFVAAAEQENVLVRVLDG